MSNQNKTPAQIESEKRLYEGLPEGEKSPGHKKREEANKLGRGRKP